MKILFATPYKCMTGGIAQWAEHIASHYEKSAMAECKLDILPMNDPKSGRSTVGMSLCHRIIYGFQTYSRVLRNLKKRLSSEKYDILHIKNFQIVNFCIHYKLFF